VNSGPTTLLNPVDSSVVTGRHMVVVFNNDHTSMEVVIEVLMLATGCDQQEAFMEMWEAHRFGRASVHFASEAECHEVARVIGSVGVKTEVRLEWAD